MGIEPTFSTFHVDALPLGQQFSVLPTWSLLYLSFSCFKIHRQEVFVLRQSVVYLSIILLQDIDAHRIYVATINFVGAAFL